MLDRAFLAKLVLATLLLLGALWFLGGQGMVALVQQLMDVLRDAGVGTFFIAMALLPAVGAPLTFFTLTAGPTFGPQLGMPNVIFLCLVAISVNMSLGYVLAQRALRPPLQRLLLRLGYQLPDMTVAGTSDLVILVRVTPGVPFPVQNFLLGLAAVPFPRYLALSCLIAFPLNAAIIFFGEALLQGRGRSALLGLLLVVAMTAGLSLLRKRFRPGGHGSREERRDPGAP